MLQGNWRPGEQGPPALCRGLQGMREAGVEGTEEGDGSHGMVSFPERPLAEEYTGLPTTSKPGCGLEGWECFNGHPARRHGRTRTRPVEIGLCGLGAAHRA